MTPLDNQAIKLLIATDNDFGTEIHLEPDGTLWDHNFLDRRERITIEMIPQRMPALDEAEAVENSADTLLVQLQRLGETALDDLLTACAKSRSVKLRELAEDVYHRWLALTGADPAEKWTPARNHSSALDLQQALDAWRECEKETEINVTLEVVS